MAEKNPILSIIQVEVHGRKYDAVSHRACHTCTHPARAEIEMKIVQGHTYRSIADMYSGTEWTQPDGEVITLPSVAWGAIFHHFKNKHLPTELAVLRTIADNRAVEMGQNYEAQVDHIVDGHTFAQQVLTKTQQRLASGELQPDLKDGLAAAKLIQEIEQGATGSVDAEAWSQAFIVYFEHARRFMDDETWKRFSEALSTDPILLGIQRRQNASPENEIIDGEVVPNPKEVP